MLLRNKKKVIFSWAMYDLANTAFSALFVTFFFPLYIKDYLGGNEFHIGLVMGVSMLIAAFFVPFIGAISDITKKRRPIILLFTILCVIFTILVAFVNLVWALIFGLLANLAYHSCLDIYDTQLYDISTKKSIGRISGYGVALGYIGSILSLIVAFIILSKYGFESKGGVQLIFPATGIFFLVFSIPLFLWVKDAVVDKRVKIAKELRNAFFRLIETVKGLKKNKNLVMFLIASFLYTDGMNTAIIFLYLYGRDQIGLSVVQFFFVYGLMAIAAAAGSFIFGVITDKVGPIKTLFAALLLWIVIIIILINVQNIQSFILAGSLGGVALGAVWTATRPMLVELSPKKDIAQLFGFQGLTEKFSGFLGPIVFGFMVVRTGYQSALLVLLGLFVLGFVFLLFVKNKK